MQHSGKSLNPTGATAGTVVQVYVGTRVRPGAVIIPCNGKKIIADISFVPT